MSTKSFLFPFGHLPLIHSASGMHNTLCFCVCWYSPKFTVLLEMGVTTPHTHTTSLCSCWLWSLIWERYFLTAIALACEYGFLGGCSVEEESGSWVQQWAAAVPACPFQPPLPVARACVLLDWGHLNLTLANVPLMGKSIYSIHRISAKLSREKKKKE